MVNTNLDNSWKRQLKKEKKDKFANTTKEL